MTNMGQLVLMAAVLAVAKGFSGFGGAGGFGGFDDIFSSFFGGGGAQSNPTAPRQEMIYNIVSILLLKRRYLALKKKSAITVNKLVIPVMEMVLNQVLKLRRVINVADMVKCKSRVIHH